MVVRSSPLGHRPVEGNHCLHQMLLELGLDSLENKQQIGRWFDVFWSKAAIGVNPHPGHCSTVEIDITWRGQPVKVNCSGIQCVKGHLIKLLKVACTLCSFRSRFFIPLVIEPTLPTICRSTQTNPGISRASAGLSEVRIVVLPTYDPIS